MQLSQMAKVEVTAACQVQGSHQEQPRKGKAVPWDTGEFMSKLWATVFHAKLQ